MNKIKKEKVEKAINKMLYGYPYVFQCPRCFWTNMSNSEAGYCPMCGYFIA